MNFISPTASVDDKARLSMPVRMYPDVVVRGRVEIGKYTYLGNRTRVYGPATIGSYCALSRDIEIAPWNHPLDHLSVHPFQYNQNHFGNFPGYGESPRVPRPDKATVALGHDVWIGTKAFINAGITIGTGAVVAANAAVVRDVPPYTIVAGCPARPIRKRFDDATVDRLLESAWWELEPGEMSGVSFADISVALQQVADIRAALGQRLREALRQPVRNRSSGSAVGLLWWSVAGAPLLGDLIRPGESLEVLDVKPSEFKGKRSTLEPGSYVVSSCEYDPVKRAIRTSISDARGQLYAGPLSRGSVEFRLPAYGQD